MPDCICVNGEVLNKGGDEISIDGDEMSVKKWYSEYTPDADYTISYIKISFCPFCGKDLS